METRQVWFLARADTTARLERGERVKTELQEVRGGGALSFARR